MSAATRLALRTPVEWVARVAEQPLELLADHAHCELKAASSAQALLAKNADRPELVQALTSVAIEELEHFRAVLGVLRARGGSAGPARRSPYAEGLHARAAASRCDPLLDRLVISYLIEARSLERFQLLAAHLADDELAALYRSLLRSEAGHRSLFLRLARTLFPEAADERVAALGAEEAAVVAGLAFEPRMHSGTGG